MKVLVSLILLSTFVSLPAVAEQSEIRLAVSLTDKRLHIWKGEEILARYDVAIGAEEHPTPEGKFLIRRLVWNPGWVPPPNAEWAKGKTAKKPTDHDNPIKAVKIFFRQPDYYIHGTSDVASIGKAASHGCIRVTARDAVEIGRIVMEHGGKAVPDPWYRRVLRSRKTQAVTLTRPVPIIVGK